MKACILVLEREEIVVTYSSEKELNEKLQPYIDKGEGYVLQNKLKLKVI